MIMDIHEINKSYQESTSPQNYLDLVNQMESILNAYNQRITEWKAQTEAIHQLTLDYKLLNDRLIESEKINAERLELIQRLNSKSKLKKAATSIKKLTFALYKKIKFF